MNRLGMVLTLPALAALLTLPLTVVAQAEAPAAAEPEPAEEIVVTGVLPGPPLWKVYNGDNVLWIFGYLTPIPQHMQWQSDRVEKVLANAQEYLPMPTTEVSVSAWVKYNPINIVRGLRLASRLSKNPDDKTLADVLTPELYQRFAALKTKYFPRDDDIERTRPLRAGSTMSAAILKKENLAQANDILKRISRIAGKNRKLKTTEVEIKLKLEGGYSTIAERVETLANSITPEQEQACFEWQVARMETDLEAMKSRANSWAEGYVDEFRGIKLQRGEDDPCFNLLLGSSEGETVADVLKRQQLQWLDAAEHALKTNASTFAVLNIRDLLSKDGMLAKLQARGYQVQAPH
ncbi:MAG TPA: TraB/GumN family protein [Candidatus Acidoferrum sp.]|nr:TraB/GumN family protein [Candidatus Acidoferrum sp.]